MIGETMFVSGLAMFLTAPIAGRLAVKIVGLAAAGIVMKPPAPADTGAGGPLAHVSRARPDFEGRDALYGTEIPHLC